MQTIKLPLNALPRL